jgi:hypothetical protein
VEQNWRVSFNWVTASVSFEDWKFGTVDSIVEYLAKCHIP